MAQTEGTTLNLLLHKNYGPSTDKLFSAVQNLFVGVVSCTFASLLAIIKFYRDHTVILSHTLKFCSRK